LQAAPAQAAARQAPPGPAAPPEAPDGSRAAGAVSPPGLLDGVRNPEPDYPFASRQRGDEGVVTVRLGISAAGEVTEVEVIATSGHPALDEAARRAAQRWRFRPATRDGVPIPGSIRTAVHFRLR
ncbi:MAG: energy transducer TonB, partial [Acetobacteraceae bacterium]|nr:energy transducer TonB [Acetobacteraceae bacterium]